MAFDLLNPAAEFRENYLHQLKQTIVAYNPTQIVLGEALQNSIDAIVEADGTYHEIIIDLDLDNKSVKVTDTGIGFPNNPKLLFLGGGTKRDGNPRLFGFVGVGIKVVLFSSKKFSIRAHSNDESFYYQTSDAYQFDKEPPPNLHAPDQFRKDSSPLKKGTEIYYQFPNQIAHDPIEQFIQNMHAQCLPQGNDTGFGKTLKSAVDRGFYENRFSGLMEVFLRRYTYAGDVLNYLGRKKELTDTAIKINVSCSDPSGAFGDENDVIALFFELLGKEYLTGYQSFGLSQVDRYDGRFLIKRSSEKEDSIVPADDRQLSAIDFKVTAASLIQDLEREAKDPRELKLVIAWNEGSSNSDQFGFADIEHSSYHPDRVYPAVTRYLQNTRSGAQIQVLLLKSVVDNIREKQIVDE